MKKIFVLLSGLILSGILFAQNPNLGSAGAQFLQIPLSAKESAMAGAVVSLTSDASSVFWNPAGMAKAKGVSLNLSYMKWFELFDMNSAAVVYNIGDIGVIGASVISFSTKQIEITTEQEPNGTNQFYDAQDIAIGVSYARFLTEDFNVGVSIKYINQSIWNESASGFAFDIGTQYNLRFQNLTIAMSMKNFGSNLQFSGADLETSKQYDPNYPLSRLAPADLRTASYPLPLTFQVGIGMDIYNSEFLKIIGGIDAVHPNDNRERIQFGTQASFYERFFIRGGYYHHHDTLKFVLGAGANLPMGDNVIEFDYAYLNYDLLPVVHSISLGLKIF